MAVVSISQLLPWTQQDALLLLGSVGRIPSEWKLSVTVRSIFSLKTVICSTFVNLIFRLKIIGSLEDFKKQ